MIVDTNTVANQPVTLQQLNVLRHGKIVKLRRKHQNLSDFEHGLVLGVRQAGLSISQTAD